LVVRAALYDAEDEKTSAETRNGETTDAIGGFKGWSDLCPYGVLEAQSGSILAQVQQAQNVILWYLYAPVPRSITSTERNEQIRKRHAEGESYSELAKVYKISSQLIGQIIHGRHR